MFGKLKDYCVNGSKILFTFEGAQEGVQPCVEVVSDWIVNVFVDYTGTGHRTRAIEGELGERLNSGVSGNAENVESVSQKENGVEINTRELTVVVGDGFLVDFYYRQGTPLSLAHRGRRTKYGAVSGQALELLAKEGHEASAGTENDYRVQEVRSLGDADCIYGLGDKTGFLNKRAYEYEMW